MWMVILECTIIVLLGIQISCQPVDSGVRGGGDGKGGGVYELNTRQRRKGNSVNSNSNNKWFRKQQGKSGALLPFQKRVHDFIRKDNKNSNNNNFIGNSREKELSKETFRRTEKDDSDDRFRVLANVIANNVVLGSDVKKLRPRFHHVVQPRQEPPTGQKQLWSLERKNAFDYKSVTSFKSIDLKDFDSDSIRNNNYSENETSFLIAFNITLPHEESLTRSAERTELVVNLLPVSGKQNDDNDDDEDEYEPQPILPLCDCTVHVRELPASQLTYTKLWSVTTTKMTTDFNGRHTIAIGDIASKWRQSGLLMLNVTFDCAMATDNNNDENDDDEEKKLDEFHQPTSSHFKVDGNRWCVKNVENLSLQEMDPSVVIHSETGHSDEHADINPPEYDDSYDEFGVVSPNSKQEHDSSTLKERFTLRDISELPGFRNGHTTGEAATTSDKHSAVENSSFGHTRTRFRRRARRGGADICRKRRLYVKFADINWVDVISQPSGYQAYQCVGRCYSPMSQYLTPTSHAIVQTLVHSSNPRRASRACCVPTKLGPISVFFYGDWKKKRLDNMVVKECGCR